MATMALCRIYPAASIAVSLLVSFAFRQARKRGVALDVTDDASTLLLTSEFLAGAMLLAQKRTFTAVVVA
uniref:Putative secreted protein n=1 Tax=Ixodes ricinus TaxID=34613 RepID=A0A6B0U1Y0_IXORI